MAIERIPNKVFYETVGRCKRGKDGFALQDYENATVPMMYNHYGIKIRVQCSSCQDYQIPIKGKVTFRTCPRCQTFGTWKIPNGRFLCKMWKMSDVYQNIGRIASKAKVKSPKYISWFNQHFSELAAEHSKYAPVAKPFLDFVHERFEELYGQDIYGKQLSNYG